MLVQHNIAVLFSMHVMKQQQEQNQLDQLVKNIFFVMFF